jgi:hypothetical protein
MEQGQLILALLVLLVLGVGAIALMAVINAKNATNEEMAPSNKKSLVTDPILLAHLRKDFMNRYPNWASRDCQNDPSSPWFSDPDFANGESLTRSERKAA